MVSVRTQHSLCLGRKRHFALTAHIRNSIRVSFIPLLANRFDQLFMTRLSHKEPLRMPAAVDAICTTVGYLKLTPAAKWRQATATYCAQCLSCAELSLRSRLPGLDVIVVEESDLCLLVRASAHPTIPSSSSARLEGMSRRTPGCERARRRDSRQT